MSNWQGPAARAYRLKREQEFARFKNAYVKSRPSRQALKDGYLSSKEPERALQKIHRKYLLDLEAKKAEEERIQREKIPQPLRFVVAAQLKNGRWPCDHDELKQVLGSGHGVPDPPEGIVDWKWTTGLCLVFIRRYPEHLDFTARAYERGVYHVNDFDLLMKARDWLPPSDLDAQLDPEMVKKGKWSECLESTLKNEGYESFLRNFEPEYATPRRPQTPPPPEPPPPKMSAPYVEKQLWRANTLRAIGISRLKMSSQLKRGGGSKMGISAAVPLEHALPIYSSLADTLRDENERDLNDVFPERQMMQNYETAANIPSPGKPQQTLEKEEPVQPTGDVIRHVNEETQEVMIGMMEKLGESRAHFTETMLQHQLKLEKEYVVLRKRKNLKPIPAAKELAQNWSDQLTVGEENNRLKEVLGYDGRPGWDKWTRRIPVQRKCSNLKHRRRSPVAVAVEEKEEEGKEEQGIIRRTKTAEMQHKFNVERLEDQCERRVQIIIKRLSAYERIVHKLRKDIFTSAREYRTAVAIMEKNHAFDRVTSEINEARVATCALIEAITAWREVQSELDVTKSGDKQNPPALESYPFLWHGTNILLEVPNGLDFLDQCKELHDWYGERLSLRNNPFMLAVCYHERPVTPRSAMRRVLVDGKQVLRISNKLAEQRERDARLLSKKWKLVDSGPTWWPKCSKEIWFRVRVCEKVLIKEEENQKAFESRLEL